MTPAQWDIQVALNDMERRIREDIHAAVGDVRQVALAARDVADKAQRDGYAHAGRLTSLEEKANWGMMGFFSGIAALCGLAWRVFTSGSVPKG